MFRLRILAKNVRSSGGKVGIPWDDWVCLLYFICHDCSLIICLSMHYCERLSLSEDNYHKCKWHTRPEGLALGLVMEGLNGVL